MSFSLAVALTIILFLLASAATIYGCYQAQQIILPDANQVWLNFTTTYPDGSETHGRQMMELDQPTELYQLMLDGDSASDEAGTTEYVIQKLESGFSLLSPRNQMLYRSLSAAMVFLPLLYAIIGISLCAWSFYRKKLAPPLKLLADATEQIRKQDLDFSIVYDRRDEFGQLCDSFEEMRKALYEKNRQLWNMLEERRLLQASVAHDLRNPIAIIGGYVEYLQKNVPQGKVDQDKLLHTLDNIATASKRLEQYTNSIRDINSLENIEVHRIPGNLPELLQNMADDLAVMVKQKDLRFQPVIHVPSCTVLVDPQILYRILENLFANALRFAQSEIRMEVSLESPGCLSIRITDDGEGFHEKNLKGRNTLVYTTDTTGDHLGMGLIISRILCQKLGGQLDISNNAEGGASVKITIAV